MGAIKTKKKQGHLCENLCQFEANIEKLNASLIELQQTIDKVKTRVFTLEKQHQFWKGWIGGLMTVGGVIGAFFQHIMHAFWSK